MSRSTPVVSPTTSNRTCLPSSRARSRDQAGEAADAVAQRPHPAGEDLVVQAAGEVLVAAGEDPNASTEWSAPAGTRRPGPGPAQAARAPRPRSRRSMPGSDRRRRNHLPMPAIDRRSSRPGATRSAPTASLEAARAHRPAGGAMALHQRLARQAQQPRQALGRHPDDRSGSGSRRRAGQPGRRRRVRDRADGAAPAQRRRAPAPVRARAAAVRSV